MTSPTLHDSVAMRTRTKRAVREFQPKLWLDGGTASGNLVANPGFETLAGGGADVFGSWQESGAAITAETTDVDSGTNSCKFTSTDGALVWIRQTILTVGKTYTVRFRAKYVIAGGIAIQAAASDIQFILTNSWQTFTTTFVAAATTLMFKRTTTGVTNVFLLDNVACWEVGKAPTDSALVPSWTSRDVSHVEFSNPPVATHPVYTAASQAVTFDGTDDYLTKATPTLTGTSGRVCITCATGEVDELQVLFSQSDTATATHYLHLGINASNVMYYAWNNGGTAKVLTGNATLGTDTHVLEWVSDGSTITMFVDGSEQTVTEGTAGDNDGDWFGDVTGADNTTIGASIDDTGTPESPFTGSIADIVALEPDDTEANVGRLRRTLARLGAVTLASGIGLLLTDGAGILLSDGSGLLRG